MVKKINSTPLLHCVELKKYYQYPNFLVKILNGITITVHYNEIIAIVGASGSGKSTLLYLMGGLDNPTSGDIFFEGYALNQLSNIHRAKIRNKRMGFVYQFHHLLPDFSVLENVAMPLFIGGSKFNVAKKKAQFILDTIGLKSKAFHYPYELSGGESQRIAVARSIINNPILVLADEPTGNLDEKNSDLIWKLLKTLNLNYKTTFILATHDLNLAKKCDRIFTISHGLLQIYT